MHVWYIIIAFISLFQILRSLFRLIRYIDFVPPPFSRHHVDILQSSCFVVLWAISTRFPRSTRRYCCSRKILFSLMPDLRPQLPSHPTSPSRSSRQDLPAGTPIRSPLYLNSCSCHPASWLANRNVSSYRITTLCRRLIPSMLFIPRFVGTPFIYEPIAKIKSWLNFLRRCIKRNHYVAFDYKYISSKQWNGVVSCFIDSVWI